MSKIIRAIPECRDPNNETTPVCSGDLRYRVNCLGKLIIQTKITWFVMGKGWKKEWVDAKAHHITMADE